MKLFNIISLLIILLTVISHAQARALPGWFDLRGNPVHTADEVDVTVSTVVQPVPSGYKYTYAVHSLPSSLQDLVLFEVAIPDPYSVIAGSESSPWADSQGSFPNNPKSLPPLDPNFTYPLSSLTITWVGYFKSFTPGTTLSGFTFESPFPPGIVNAHIKGDTAPPVFWNEEDELPEFYDQTIYGPGKVFPVIGPVKPAGAVTGTPASNVTVQSCTGNSCSVQVNATGPMDPYGTAYTYTWSGSFGSASGANPTIQLPPGTTPVTLSVSDANGVVLATATMDIVVVNPNPPGDGKGGAAGGKGKKHGKHDEGHEDDSDDDDRDNKKKHEKQEEKQSHDD